MTHGPRRPAWSFQHITIALFSGMLALIATLLGSSAWQDHSKMRAIMTHGVHIVATVTTVEPRAHVGGDAEQVRIGYAWTVGGQSYSGVVILSADTVARQAIEPGTARHILYDRRNPESHVQRTHTLDVDRALRTWGAVAAAMAAVLTGILLRKARRRMPSAAPISDAAAEHAEALQLARAGIMAGAILIMGTALTLVFHESYIAQTPSIDSFFELVLIQGMLIGLASVLSWGMWRGRGSIAAPVLLVWLLVEITAMVAQGAVSGFWIVLWFYAIACLVSSIIGHARLRRLTKTGAFSA